MSETVKQFFGIAGTLVAIYAIIPYMLDIKRGNTKPHKMAQIIFMIISAISFVGQLKEGATASLYLTAFFFVIPIIALYLSRKEKIGSITRADIATLLLCLLVLCLWGVTSSSSLAIILITVVNFIGKVLVAIKVYRFPNSELLSTWILSVVASLLAAISVGELNIILLLPSLHNAVTVGAIAVLIGWRRRTLSTPA